MKKIFLMRHSIPEKGIYRMSRFLYRKREKRLLYQKEIYFQMWTDAFLHLIGEQWKRLNSSQITRSL